MRKLIFILIALISFSQAQTIQYIGAPTTTVISRGNFRTDSIFYLPKRTKLPTDTAAFRYQISDSSLYYWTGYQWTKVQSASSFASVDTTVISTRAWRQKGIDSVQYNVGLKVNISDTSSMLSPYLIGSGTSNYFPKFNATRSVINSKLYESNLNLLFNSTTPYITTSGISTIENNGTSASVYVLKTLDTARAYVSFGGANTMDINNLRAGDIRFYTNATLRGRFQTDGTFRLNSLTGTGSRIVVADDNGVLSATSSATGLVDTTLLSTRAYRQKGDDSLGAIIATKGSGTVTSVATGYGLSGGTITTTGTISADTAIMATRLRVGKVVDSLSLVKQNVLTNPVTGTGTTNYVPKFTGTSTIGNSVAYDNSGEFLINTITDNGNYKLQVNGNTYLAGDLRLNTSSGFNTLITQPLGTGGIAMVSVTDPAAQFDRLFSLGFGSVNYPANARIEAYASQAWSSTARGTYLSFRTTPNGSATIQDRMIIDNNGYVGINTYTPLAMLHIAGNLRNNDSAFFATSSGRVGVGTATPAVKFEVTGTGAVGRFTSSNDPRVISIYHTGSSVSSIGFSGTTSTNDFNVRVGADGNDYIAYTNNTERMRITSSGETLFGTTTDAGNYRVQVSGNAYVSGALSVGTSSPSASAIIDATSTTQGFLPPRMTTTQRDAISSPAAGLVIYNTTTSKLQVYTTSWTDLH